MKKIMSKGKTIKTILIYLMILIIIFSIGSMVYIKMTYDQSFSRIEQPDSKYAGYHRYSDVDEYQHEEVEFELG